MFFLIISLLLVRPCFLLNPQLFVITYRPLWFALAWGSTILDNDASYKRRVKQFCVKTVTEPWAKIWRQ